MINNGHLPSFKKGNRKCSGMCILLRNLKYLELFPILILNQHRFMHEACFILRMSRYDNALMFESPVYDDTLPWGLMYEISYLMELFMQKITVLNYMKSSRFDV